MRHEISKHNHPIEQEELMAYLDGELPRIGRPPLWRIWSGVSNARLSLPICGACLKLLAWEVESPTRRWGQRSLRRLSNVSKNRRKPQLQTSGRADFITLRKVMPWVGWAAASGFALVLFSITKLAPAERKSTKEHKFFCDPHRTTRDSRFKWPLHGLGDHAQNSFSVNGQPIPDQESKTGSIARVRWASQRKAV